MRRRRNEWLAAGVLDRLVTEAIEGYDRIIGLDLSEVDSGKAVLSQQVTVVKRQVDHPSPRPLAF
ncbi:MAG: hypothetical protein ACR2MO_00930 [Acidimicrobiales bacterium]